MSPSGRVAEAFKDTTNIIEYSIEDWLPGDDVPAEAVEIHKTVQRLARRLLGKSITTEEAFQEWMDDVSDVEVSPTRQFALHSRLTLGPGKVP